MIRKNEKLPLKKQQLIDALTNMFPLFNDDQKINVEE
jgi:hypothetical protein